jgi:hypothetical protein
MSVLPPAQKRFMTTVADVDHLVDTEDIKSPRHNMDAAPRPPAAFSLIDTPGPVLLAGRR